MSDSSQSILEIRLFGHFQGFINGKVIDERCWQRRKAKMLVKILALQPNFQINREQLAEMLSPNLDITASLNNLNKNIHSARRTLEPDLKRGVDSRFILTQGQQVVLRASELLIDVSEFERRAEVALKNRTPQAYESALELYTDDLLLEDLYEDWLTAKRERLRLLRKRLVSQLAALYDSQKRFDLAIHYLNLLIVIDGTDEEAHRRLMRVYTTTDDKSLALRQYKICTENLRTLLDVNPESETQALYQQILAGKYPPQANIEKPQASEPQSLKQTPLAATAKAVEEGSNTESAKVLASDLSVRRNPAKSRPNRSHARYLVPLGLAVMMLISAGVLKSKWRNDTLKSLIVLPCENTTGDSTFDYLTDGISETLMRNLSQLPELQVIARHTAFQYQGKAVEPRKVCDELQVGGVLSGKIFDRNGQPFINLELFNAIKGDVVWSETRQFVADDIFNLERQMEASLIQTLRPQLAEVTVSIDKSRTTNPAAYAAYLKGRYYWNRRFSDDLKKAVVHFQEATDLDPLYALAYTGLADAYVFGGGGELSPSAYMPRAKLCAQKALELDEGIAEAHTSLAFIAEYYEWDFEVAEKEFQRAVTLNPNYATARHWYGEFLAFMGKHDEAIKQIRKAQELDPLSIPLAIDVGVIFHYARQYDKAIAQFQQLAALDAGRADLYAWLTLLHFENAQPELARQAYQKFKTRTANNPIDMTNWSLDGHFYALSGNRKMALQEIEKLKTVGPNHHPGWAIAQIMAILNEKDEAFKWLDVVYENRGGGLISLKTNPFFDNLRSDPRFAKLLKRIGLIA
jgi:DNA-binding SARP family transcriptional activator/TolB-like protein